MARSRIRRDSSSGVGFAKFPVPSQSGDTSTPVRPRSRYVMVASSESVEIPTIGRRMTAETDGRVPVAAPLCRQVTSVSMWRCTRRVQAQISHRRPSVPGRGLTGEEDMMPRLDVLNPVAEVEHRTVTPASRPSSLEGKTVGLIWNMKAGGDIALNRITELMGERIRGVRIVRFDGAFGGHRIA